MLKTAATFIFDALFSAPIYYNVFDNKIKETPVSKIEHQLKNSPWHKNFGNSNSSKVNNKVILYQPDYLNTQINPVSHTH